ncbi:tRNA pseudouridine(55) synthase TruB [Heyndrickxia ginsengihumi]|uniref:tRNA pseudouridine synthase B n=1 Tax=Heyndrickxia ginsengihumi TaxID=363870 RepID=A0A0A6VIS7_9BACI|nr:tRNA pseudouridine(55) synthase TruB [Heyndrickxia ginsengihumi]KHD86539.1 tRNA pseudouridine synthase B [Heyndrickxia ginsengihumi]MBE6182797.1 tRNA pseudouridine(55) synthase TruB [Bacillus sp. (in: firmicutes)]MCM3022537.1 tRNA pseudouridine(55) synthase TruB [Heyndrickxia ginsengihumi]NEY19657.1 tRNA pseudouridine(55) synthase TruB [Heyndrickxia ginsengihumi]
MDGIIPLWKPAGLTSHDCVFKVRKLLKTKKVGHTGTLDPDVTGVLPICIGKATKIVEYITNAGKEYEGEVTLGYSTTTEDSGGEMVREQKIEHPISRNEILRVLSELTGCIQQTPPMYSAVKVNGKRLYEYARQGIEVERPTREVQIYSLELLDDRDIYTGSTISFRFRVSCSKGTYIRTLAVMMGEKLGYPAHMSYLTRISAGGFTKDQCATFEDIEEHMEHQTITELLHPLEAGLIHLPKWEINDTLAEKVKNGMVLEKGKCWPDGEEVAVMYREKVIAIYKVHPSKPSFIKPVKVIQNEF